MVETFNTLREEEHEDMFFRQKHCEPEGRTRYIFWNPVQGICKIFHVEDYRDDIEMLKVMDVEMRNWINL